MPKSEKPFARLFRLYFIVQKEQDEVRKSLLKTKDNNQVIQLINRYDILQRRKEWINAIKLKF